MNIYKITYQICNPNKRKQTMEMIEYFVDTTSILVKASTFEKAKELFETRGIREPWYSGICGIELLGWIAIEEENNATTKESKT
jgi:hypothetical protein